MPSSSDMLFRLAFDAAPAGLLMVDAGGFIKHVNAQVEKLLGYARDELVGHPVEILLPKRFRERHPDYREAFLQAPRARPMGMGRDLYALRKDGVEVPIEIGLTPLETDAGVFVLGSIIDLTRRARTLEHFRLTIEASPTGMMMVDSVGCIVLVNAEIERLFGYDRAELIGQPIEMLVPAELRARHPEYRGGFMRAPRARRMGAGRDLVGVCKDGARIPIEIGLNPFTTDEGTFVLSTIVDISERRVEEERTKASLREKETLLRELQHRVKNNLQILNALLNLQSRGITDEDARAVLRESQDRVMSIALAHDRLCQAVDLGRVEWRAYVDMLTRHLVDTWGRAGVAVAVEPSADAISLPVDIAIPCGLIVNELLSNALKHAFPGGRSGHVLVGTARDDTGVLTITVRDDGVGLPADIEVGRSGSLGFELVSTLARQLGARLSAGGDAGTSVSIAFRIPE
jgi:PAS domain S-box-containing protein